MKDVKICTDIHWPAFAIQVHVITSSPCGKNEVSIDIEEAATKSEVKKMLVNATGIPYEYQKVVLSGIGQLAVADKR